MISLKDIKKREQGFTIVELLIVIVVIGILAALVVTTYAGIQAKARDSKRQTDVQALQTQIEAFYAANNYYPSSADINSSSWRTTNMKSLDAGAINDPSCSGSSCGSLSNSTSITATSKQYGYAPTDGTGASCETTDTNCAKYTLTAWLEVTKATYTKSNLD